MEFTVPNPNSDFRPLQLNLNLILHLTLLRLSLLTVTNIKKPLPKVNLGVMTLTIVKIVMRVLVAVPQSRECQRSLGIRP